ncbi:SDR family oxidoreductase [Sphingomonas sp. SORGH_AS_0879]|uniref:SDR family oxidoreductase n=1 Tax=Sphingomonas sp. SORGH_AS_0879 TaxID=3041790 RepID=UPI00277DD7E8|nr:SDR family oxidoreductase [Sphingomonas sp. SORGH_AS_0879]MDQ1228582.1 nucleoside-diphosphate-sugar epimerase [Sphingomonas sp. SORGH_AS_0879]
MRVFLTGATGFIGSHIIPELLGAGHRVLGLTRSDAGADALVAAGAEAHRGDIEDLESLTEGAAACNGVIHTAFDHNFADFLENCQKDRRAIEALGAGLEGTSKPLIITSSTAMGSTALGEPASEDVFNAYSPNPRIASELAGEALYGRGIHVIVLRNSQIHDTRKQGLVSDLIGLACKKGVSAYVGEGANTWSAAHVLDTARLYRMALERNEAGARYHGTAEGAISLRDIAEAIGQTFGLPLRSVSTDEAGAHFGWLAAFASKDMSASSTLTRKHLGWQPEGPTLLTDICGMTAAG